MTDIFISYSSKDREWVETFAGLLSAQDYDVWWDSSLLAGADFQRTIRKKLKEAKCVIVVWTEYSVESMWVRSEVDHAARRNILVPIQLRDAELPMPFNIMHAENFREWQGKAEGDEFQRLLRAIRQHVALEPKDAVEQQETEKPTSVPAEQVANPVLGTVSQPLKRTELASPKPDEKPTITTKPKPVSKPDNIFQRIGNKVWVALSAVLAFGLVYAVNNTGEVWSWIQKGNADAAVAEMAQTQEMPKLLKGDQGSSSGGAELEQIEKVIELNHGVRLVKIPRGRFQMGSEGGADNEKPIHTVSIAYDFLMSETEVTFAQYDVYAAAVGKAKPDDAGWGRMRRPVINVSWHDAHSFAQWLSKNNEKGLSCRLPTESEWEYAARGGTTTNYFFGDEPGKNNANCEGCGSEWDDKKTAPVASFSANKFGLYDMHGNVWEWTQNSWQDDYQNAPLDGSARGGGSGLYVLRGGSWLDKPFYLRSAYRSGSSPDNRGRSMGFRVMCSP